MLRHVTRRIVEVFLIRIRQGTGYDSGTNGWGRLTGVSFGPLTIGNAPATESYSYTVAGDMSAKTLVNKWSLSASFTYDSEGKPVTTTYPGWGYSGTGLVQTNAYDAMSRLISVSNIEALGTVSGCTPAPPTSGTVTWASGAQYNAAGQLTDLERFGSGGNTCAGLAENYFNEHWNYNALNQLTEIDTSSQSLGFPVPSPNPGTANVFFSRYNFSDTSNNGQVASVDDARQSGANIVYT